MNWKWVITHILPSTRAFLFFQLFSILAPCLHGQTSGATIVWNPKGLYTIVSAVPFLRINPDARAAGIGSAGIATDADANAVFTNPAKLAFINTDGGFSGSFAPWLHALVNGIYLTDLNGYYRIKKKQTIAISARYFSYGTTAFITGSGLAYKLFRPEEFAIDAHYARQLGQYFSISGSVSYIYSSLATGASINGITVKPGMSGAGDIGWYFHKTYHENEDHVLQHTFSCGMTLSDMGNKMSYTSVQVPNYLPTNLGVGFNYTLDIDRHNSVAAALDLNKLMVPSPFGRWDSVHQVFYYQEESAVKGMFTSFGDAPAIQELRYITESVGMEYFYDKLYGFRFGYFYEHPSAGGRQYFSLGLTARYSVASFHFAYLIPTNPQNDPLKNTLQFTLVFDFKQKIKKQNPQKITTLIRA
jgi:hypothetical protein